MGRGHEKGERTVEILTWFWSCLSRNETDMDGEFVQARQGLRLRQLQI